MTDEQWHCHQLPGARVICEREQLLNRIAVLKDRITRAEDAAVGHRGDMVDTFDRLANVIQILTEEDV